jgi:hypothetical protein
MFEGIMITIRFRDESTSPPAEWVEALPVDTKLEVVLRMSKEATFLEQIEINRKPLYVQRGFNADIILRILFGLLRKPKSLPEG